ncbi:MAG TPA: energy transducer TonB [Saprospiraceae bacterium]|nr:energy transducer TonB [Saprospiraceae bacterium]
MNILSFFLDIISVCCLFAFSTLQTEITEPANSIVSFTIIEPHGFSQDSVVKDFDTSPVFPGCNDLDTMKERDQCSAKELLMFLYGELEYPVQARKNKVEGIGVISYVVDVDGRITNIEIPKAPSWDTEEELYRIAHLIPRMTPAKKNGVSVATRWNIPIKFRLQ